MGATPTIFALRDRLEHGALTGYMCAERVGADITLVCVVGRYCMPGGTVRYETTPGDETCCDIGPTGAVIARGSP